MINSIKYILKKRNMQQKMLIIAEAREKQYVSRYVNRERKIPEKVIEKWEKILDVPYEYFVDGIGYCKLLTSNDKEQLEDYLISQEFSAEENEKIAELIQREYDEILYWRDIERNVKEIQSKVKKNIYSDIAADVSSKKEAGWQIETNIKFYEHFLKLKNSGKIHALEWSSVFKALSCLLMKNVKSEVFGNDELARNIYSIIIEYRKEQELKRKKDIEEYEALFGKVKI